jgi:hypothetical protein
VALNTVNSESHPFPSSDLPMSYSKNIIGKVDETLLKKGRNGY